MALEIVKFKPITGMSEAVVYIWGCFAPEVRKQIANKLFLSLANEMGWDSNPADFVTLSLEAISTLQKAGNNNLIYKFIQCFGVKRPGTQELLMPIDRMPFGLISYNVEFFTCTNVHQVSHSDFKTIFL